MRTKTISYLGDPHNMATEFIAFDIHLDPDPVEGIPRPARVEIRSADWDATEGIDPATIEARDEETGPATAPRYMS